MSKKQARRYLAEYKQGCTVKEFMRLCDDMGVWFDDVVSTELERVYYALIGEAIGGDKK